jgi:hypothetical protein
MYLHSTVAARRERPGWPRSGTVLARCRPGIRPDFGLDAGEEMDRRALARYKESFMLLE